MSKTLLSQMQLEQPDSSYGRQTSVRCKKTTHTIGVAGGTAGQAAAGPIFSATEVAI